MAEPVVPEALEIGHEIVGSMFVRIPFSHGGSDENVAKNTFDAQHSLPPQPFSESKMAHVHFTAWAGNTLPGGGIFFNYDDNAGHSLPEDDSYLKEIYTKRVDFEALRTDHDALLNHVSHMQTDHDALLNHVSHMQGHMVAMQGHMVAIQRRNEVLEVELLRLNRFIFIIFIIFILTVVCILIILYLVMNRSSIPISSSEL